MPIKIKIIPTTLINVKESLLVEIAKTIPTIGWRYIKELTEDAVNFVKA